jgi:hypothetical protein
VTLLNTPIFDTTDETWRLLVERLTSSDAQRRVLLAHPEGFSNEQYRELNGVDRDEAYRQIQEMVANGIVEPADRPGRGARYQLSSNLLEARGWLEQRLPAVSEWLADHGALTNADYRELFGVTRTVALNETPSACRRGSFGAARGAPWRPLRRRAGPGPLNLCAAICTI